MIFFSENLYFTDENLILKSQILLFSSLMLSSVFQTPYISPWILNIPESQSLNPSILILWIQSSMYSEKHSTSPSRKMKISHFSLILLLQCKEQHTINNYLSCLQMDCPSNLSSEVAKHFPIWAKRSVYMKKNTTIIISVISQEKILQA